MVHGQFCVHSSWPGYLQCSTSMPIYPDAHRYWKQRRRVLLLCDSCGQYVGACRTLAAYKSLIVSLVLIDGWTTQRYAVRPACLTTVPSSVRHQCGGKIDLQSSVFGPRNVRLDGTALVECSRSRTSKLRRWSSVVSMTLQTWTLDVGLAIRSLADTDILLVPRSWLVTVGDRSFPVSWTTNMEQFTIVNTFSTIYAVI